MLEKNIVKLTPMRWYVLALFSLLAMFQCTVWNTWGPVEKVALSAYSWSPGTISVLASWGNWVLPFMIPCIILTNWSLRAAVVLGAALMAFGTTLRCAIFIWPSMSIQLFTVLCHICAFCNGISGIIFCSAPPLVSAAWFPPSERVTATSIGQAFNGLGSGLGFLIARLMVESRPPNYVSTITENNATEVTQGERDFFLRESNNYVLLLAAPPLLLFMLSVVNFPSKPLHPPSESAQLERTPLLQGAKDLLAKKGAWVVMVVMAVSQSIPGTWGAMMVVNLQTLHVDGSFLTEEWIDTLAVTATVVSTITSILAARLTDSFRGQMKTSCLVLLTASGSVFSLLTLVSVGTIRMPHFLDLEVAVFVLFLVGSALVTACSPLMLEFAVELCYPASEILTGGWIFLGYGLGSLVFLLLFEIPGLGYGWLNYILPASSFVCLPLLALVQGNYNRLEVDTGGTS